MASLIYSAITSAVPVIGGGGKRSLPVTAPGPIWSSWTPSGFACGAVYLRYRARSGTIR
jgi:hypothetical protein